METSNVLELSSTIEQDEITKQVSKVFDYEFSGEVKEHIEIPTFPSQFEIGVIYGSSGSGKSTIMKNVWGGVEDICWDNNKSIASHFGTFEEASRKFGASGLNSIPTWLKPYRVLSNGEKFRADMARQIKSGARIDEFTSVVNREVAKSCSMSLSKYIKNEGLKNIVICTCHNDIIPYLQPTWVYNTDTHNFENGRYLRRDKLCITIQQCSHEKWASFKKYHYLSGDINKASNCFVCELNGEEVAFIAILAFPNGCFKNAFREHRLVVHPDFQGMGIGNKLSETIAQSYLECGCKYFAKTSNPRIGNHRDKSTLWRGTCNNHKNRLDYLNKDGTINGTPNKRMSDDKMRYHAQRVCYSHEYIGDGKTYPYTYVKSTDNIIVGQMNIFDYLKEDKDELPTM